MEDTNLLRSLHESKDPRMVVFQHAARGHDHQNNLAQRGVEAEMTIAALLDTMDHSHHGRKRELQATQHQRILITAAAID